MAVSGIGNNYNNVYGSTYAARKNEAAETKDTASAQADSTKGAGADRVSNYYSYLRKNYDCVKNGSVAISGAYLKECANNAKKAEELEENLSYFKEGYENGLKSARANARSIGARLVNYSESWSIDSTGNITMMASATVTSDSSVKGWKELAEEREEKLKEKKERERAEEKKAEEKSAYKSSRKYSEYLNNKYACLTPTKDSSVSINPALLSKAASNPKTARWLENTLSQMPDCINKICENSAKNGARLVSLEISIDSEDCITTKCVGVFESDPGTEESKKMLKEARARNKERKEEWEKLLEKKKEEKAKQQKQAEKISEQEFSGSPKYDIKAKPKTSPGFDIKA